MYKTLNLSSHIKMIVSDFDGIFTDNTVYILDESKRVKRLSYKDLMGVSIAVKNGLKIAIISGECSPEIEYIAKTFNITDIHQGIRNKLPIYEEIIAKYDLKSDEVLYIGDDINDIACLELSKYAVSVNEANYKVKQLKHVQLTQASAGDGAFREVVDNIIELRQITNGNEV